MQRGPATDAIAECRRAEHHWSIDRKTPPKRPNRSMDAFGQAGSFARCSPDDGTGQGVHTYPSRGAPAPGKGRAIQGPRGRGRAAPTARSGRTQAPVSGGRVEGVPEGASGPGSAGLLCAWPRPAHCAVPWARAHVRRANEAKARNERKSKQSQTRGPVVGPGFPWLIDDCFGRLASSCVSPARGPRGGRALRVGFRLPVHHTPPTRPRRPTHQPTLPSVS